MKIVALFPEAVEGQDNQLLNTDKAIGLKSFLQDKGHELVIMKDGKEDLDKHLEDMEVVISAPFYPAYMTKERIEKAPNLKLAITAGVGSDHVDLDAASQHNISVVEVTGSNTVSVAEHAVMDLLILLRNYEEGHRQSKEGEWNLSQVGNDAYELQHKTIGIFGFGRIGQLVAERLAPFNVTIQHYDPINQKDNEHSKFVKFDELVKTSDAITIHAPLTPETDNLFDSDVLAKMKDGSFLVNTARGKIVNTDALVKALEDKRVQGYAGDVWYPQPAPADHPWRTMPRNAMTVHYSGMTLEAQKRIEDGVKDILNRFFNDQPFQDKDVIVSGGRISSASYNAKNN
ncbi:NAD-dependent formate dehydrogenase [Staphylococcus pettenkoferi]|uniref:D-lactate dehydrogenase n=1 Tax=Staphylococcus pettenkoferi TaxID=170573 RepID=A0ABT4BLB0_9STAP|nr:NAD-dependent formate dehydrogenase [Staphylococcus pettenkoferi]MCI2803209.1 NAD-dependent formate dehydrogenase [Staphylococcus pettenkoferi]MCY1583463.1 NAD-dependent formate dehydrogenase [Staphylococcus pettenkoferi]MCY1589151.1 NAD-dependent formate dehydrogenase [Staphylococcus pettenkoferi]MCY1591769.1 NAD-dependent formate dehydrogenase [Staphylococcus pettenkoferi]MCY1596294.1 NAD-dependent formate dehydrogenase [Staphylococcus pettenkoferi]